MLLFPNATNDWTKSWFFNPHILEISKVVYKKCLSCNTPAKLDAILLRSACTCYKCGRGFHIPYAWQSLLVNNFVDFLNVRVKKIWILSSRWQCFVIATSAIRPQDLRGRFKGTWQFYFFFPFSVVQRTSLASLWLKFWLVINFTSL